MLKQRQATLYGLKCDNCGTEYRQYQTDDMEYEDPDILLDEAADDGWCGLYGGKEEPPEGKDHLSYAENHFCCEECMEKWLQRRRFKEGDLVRWKGGDYIVELDEDDDGNVHLHYSREGGLCVRANEVQLLMTVEELKKLKKGGSDE